MSARHSSKSSITAPGGDRLSAGLKAKARARRERQAALSEVPRVRRRNDLSPDLATIKVPIDSLRPADRRVRKPDPVQAARLDQSLARFGLCQPILVDGERRIVHGHELWEAAKRAGLTEVQVIEISHLSAPERRALSIILNRLGETGTWDEEHLKLEIMELIELDEGVLDLGFSAPELDLVLLNDEADEPEEECETVQRGPAVSRPGDLWTLGDHKLLQGDATAHAAYARLMGEETARIVFTDEPFNVPIQGHVSGKAHLEFAMASGEMTAEEFGAFNRAWMEGALTHLMPGGLLATFIDWRSVELVLKTGREVGLELLNLVVWSKTNAGQGSLWRSAHELLPVFKKPGAAHLNNVELGRHGRWRSNVWLYPGASSLGSDAREGLDHHPTVKPQALLADALLDVTGRGEIVLEPFSGSGSTLLACETTGRRCRAMEIDGGYCDLTIRRWQAKTGESAVLAATGQSFAEVEAERAGTGIETAIDASSDTDTNTNTYNQTIPNEEGQ